MLKHEFHRFILAGGIAAGANFLSRILLNYIVSYRTAVFIAYLIGMVVAFIIMKSYVFSLDRDHNAFEVGAFIAINILGLIQVWLVSVGLAEYFFPSIAMTFHPEHIAHLIGIGSPVITSYLAHKYITFK